MLSLDVDSGTHILGNEYIIEDHHAGQVGRPCAISKNKRRAPSDLNDDFGRMLCSQAMALGYPSSVSSAERPQDRRQSGLAAAVFGINQCQLRQWDVRSGVDRVEPADITQELNALNQGDTPSAIAKSRIANPVVCAQAVFSRPPLLIGVPAELHRRVRSTRKGCGPRRIRVRPERFDNCSVLRNFSLWRPRRIPFSISGMLSSAPPPLSLPSGLPCQTNNLSLNSPVICAPPPKPLALSC